MKKIARLRAAVGIRLKRAARGIVVAAAALLPVLFRDVAGIAGAGCVAYGMWLVYPPYGFITGGALLLAGAILASLAPQRKAG